MVNLFFSRSFLHSVYHKERQQFTLTFTRSLDLMETEKGARRTCKPQMTSGFDTTAAVIQLG